MLTLSVVFGGLYRGCPASCGLLPSGSGVEGGSGLGWGWSMCWLSHVPPSLVRCEVACTAVLCVSLDIGRANNPRMGVVRGRSRMCGLLR